MATAGGREPLLQGKIASEAREAVAALAADLARSSTPTEARANLMRGDLARAVFFAHLSRAWRAPGAADIAVAVLQDAADAFNDGAAGTHPTFFAGLPGFAWTIQHVADALDEPELADHDGLDEALLATLDDRPSWLAAEHLYGVAGFGVYALERRPRGAWRALIEAVARWLEASALADGDGVRWAPSRIGDGAATSSTVAELGPAHGVVGPIHVLCGAAACGVAGARELAERAVVSLRARWGPRAPHAWCEGDLGIAAALASAAAVAGRDDWQALALDAARTVATRAGDAMEDPSICHGTAGAAHAFHRLWRDLGDGIAGEAARASFDRLLAARRGGAMFGGLTQDELPGEVGLLFGAAGVGLALLAAVSTEEPTWDRALLLSSPVAPLP